MVGFTPERLKSCTGLPDKRYESETTGAGDSWQHARITLHPANPDFEPIVLSRAERGLLQVVAEVVEVLGGET